MKRLLIAVIISLFIAGCGKSAPRRPSTDPCLALHTLGHPDCRPWTSTPPVTPPAIAQTPKTTEARVVEAVDVDTITVLIDGTVYVVRYAGIDCTDTKHLSGPQAWLRSEAAEANRSLVEGRIVLLEKGASNEDQDGRLLRYVYVGETLVNLELLRLGYARESLHPADRRYAPMFLDGQKAARKQRLGLWSSNPTTWPVSTQAP